MADLKVGLAGLGVVSRGILPSISKVEGARLTAVADIRPEAREQAAARYGVETFDDVAAMCASPNVDAVWIATPNAFHAEHATIAAENRKHVICEKPMALNLEQCQSMIAAVERNGVRYVQGHSKIFNAPVRRMREIVSGGELGNLIQVNNWYYKPWLSAPRIETEVDSEYGGGVLYRQGPHQTDVLRCLGGGIVKTVRGIAGRFHPAFPDTEGNYSAFLEFENGAAGTMVFNGYGFFDSRELVWGIGEGGDVVDVAEAWQPRRTAPVAAAEKYAMARPEDDPNRQRRHQPFYGLTIASCERGDIRQFPDGLYLYTDDGRQEVDCETRGSTTHTGELEELISALAEDRPTFPDARWGMATVEVLMAIMESSRTHKEIELKHQVPCAF
jgi:phthalate 4,5-cis-dihydrodiol dehydrogenase